jgi:DNA polymerase-1
MPPLWGFDTETYLTQPGLPAPRLVCGSWADETSEHVGLRKETLQFFNDRLMAGDHLTGVFHAFDVVVCAAEEPDLLPLIFKAGDAGQLHCSSVLEALHDIAIDKLFQDYETGKSFSKDDLGGRYSMAILMKRHFNQDISAEKHGDVWRYKYATLDGVPLDHWPAEAVDYPKRDARRHRDIRIAQKAHQNKHDEAAQVRAAIAIHLMVTWGFRTDGDYISHLEREVDGLWNAARDEFSRAGIYRPDGSKDTKRLKALVNAAYNGDPPKTAGGDVATDRDTLTESDNPLLKKLGEGGKNDKRKTVYLPALRQGVDRPVTPQFNPLVNTGRVSSDWQQMPQRGGIREAVVTRGYLERLRTGRAPDRDTVISSNDFEGLELRTMAERAILDPDVRFSKMADFLNSGRDAHSYVAGFFLGMSLEDFLPRKNELKAYRDVAKIFNFGAGGGAGAFAIAYNAKIKDNIRLCLSLKRAERCGVKRVKGFIGGKEKRVCAACVQVAKELKEKWLKAWPEQGLLSEKAGRLTANRRKATSVTFGSKRVRGGCGFAQWLNNPFQGAGGDGMKAAMWRIQEEAYTDRRSPLWGSRIILNVHDELLTEHPWDRRHDAAFRVAEIMVSEMDKVTPHVKNAVTPAIMRRVFKSAAAVYDKAGTLKPYWPPDWNWAPDRETMLADLAA